MEEMCPSQWASKNLATSCIMCELNAHIKDLLTLFFRASFPRAKQTG